MLKRRPSAASSDIRHAARHVARVAGKAHRAVPRPGRLLVLAAACLVAFAPLAAYRFDMATGAYRNSDDAGNFLAGVEMAEGNWRLHGWVMAFDSYYPTDVLAQAVLRLLFGLHPIFMQGLEALIWAAIALAGTGLACAGARPRHLPGTVAIALALLAFNVFEHQWRDVTITNIGSHGSTILLTLLAFALAAEDGNRSGRRARRFRLALLGGTVAAGSLADPIFDVIACLPILATAVLGLHRRGGWRRGPACVAATLGGIGLAHLLRVANAHNGGFQSTSLSVTLAAFPEVLDHLAFAAGSIARLLGAGFFGRSSSEPLVGGPAIYLLRAPFVLLFAVAWWQAGGDVLRRICAWPDRAPARRGDELEHLLWLSLSLCVASTCVTTVIINQACVRFLLPAAVAGAILVARRFGRVPLTALFGGAALLASVLSGILLRSPESPRQVVALPQIHALLDTLARHHLEHGYAAYWEGTIVTVLAHRTITSIPIYVAPDGRLHPLGYLSNLDWARTAAREWHGRVFFVTSRVERPDLFALPEDAVRRAFGPPAERIDTGWYVVDIYDMPAHGLEALEPQGTTQSMATFATK